MNYFHKIIFFFTPVKTQNTINSIEEDEKKFKEENIFFEHEKCIKQEFDVVKNPFIHLGMRIEEISFSIGSVDEKNLRERLQKYCSAEYYGSRNIALEQGVILGLSKDLKIASILFNGKQLRGIAERRYAPFSIHLPLGLSFKMSQIETRHLLGSPDFSRLDTFLTNFINPGEPYYLDRYYFVEGCLEFHFNYHTQIIESLCILELPTEVLPANYVKWAEKFKIA